MRGITLLAILLAFLIPTVAWSETCDFQVGVSAYSTYGTCSGACFGGTCTPDSTDLFTVQDDAQVINDDEIFCFGGNAGWIVEDGGELTVSSRAIRDPGTFAGCIGHSDPAAGTAWKIESGGRFTAMGGYRQFGVELPILQGERELDNYTIWTWGETGVCGGGAGEVGDDCDTDGESDHIVSSYWTDAIDNPQDGALGDTFLEESIGDLIGGGTQLDMWCAWDLDPHDNIVPGENGWCYNIVAVTATDPYSVDLDVRQVSGIPENLSGYPHVDREIMGITLESAASKGDTCIDIDTGSVTADDKYAGRYFMTENTRTWNQPLPILFTRLDEDCAGNDTSDPGDESDSIHFSPDAPIPEDIPVESGDAYEAVVGYGFRPGDPAFIMAPVRMDDNSGTTSDSKFYAEDGSTVSFNAVLVGSIGQMELYGTVERFTDVYFFDCGGINNEGCIELSGSHPFTGRHVSFAGSDVTTAVGHIRVDGFTAPLRLQDLSSRYNVRAVIGTTGAEGSSGSLFVDRWNCGLKSYGTSSLYAFGCLTDTAKAFDSITINEITAVNSVSTGLGAGAVIMGAADGPEIQVHRMAGWALRGGISSGNVSVDWLVARHIDTPNTSAFLPMRMDHVDIEDVTASALTGTLNGSPSDWRRWRMHQIMHHGEDLFDGGDGHKFINFELSDPDTDDDCTDGNCDIFAYNFDNDTATVDYLENGTVSLTPGVTSAFTKIVNDESGMDADATGTHMGGLLIAGFTSDATDKDVWGIAFDSTTKVGYLVAGDDPGAAGPFCFYDNAANGTGTYYDVHASALSAYAGMYYSGLEPEFLDPYAGDFGLIGSGRHRALRCGALDGQQKPGARGSRMEALWSQIGVPIRDTTTTVIYSEEGR